MNMENKQPEGSASSGGISAPILPQTPPFSTSRREQIAAFLMYPAAWLYARLLFENSVFFTHWMPAFVLAFVALAELLHRDQPRTWESWVWLGCLGFITLSLPLGRNYVWGEGLTSLFLHLFAVWWLLCRSGRLAEGESGHLLPLDALNGFVVFPFRHFFLRIRSVWYALTHLRRDHAKAKPETVAWTVAAAVAALALFTAAARLLMAADEGFAALLSRFSGLFHLELDAEVVVRLLLSLPVGAYLFGLLAGSGRENTEALHAQGRRLCAWLETLRKVPNPVWSLLTGAFCLLYLLFFLVQARYLFGAFTRSLPEGFIVSQYARQGFFELCRVMALNFSLLWLVTRLSRGAVRQNRASLLCCVVLLLESMLFAVVAFSKLLLYIDCFGFTPLRLQSCWLVCVLFAGCVCALYSLLRGKKSFRAWLLFSAVSLTLLHLI